MNAPSGENGVMACVDPSLFAEAIADCAAWAALRMAVPLEFLHIIDRHPEIGSGDDHSGAIGVDAQEHLLHELSERDAARSAQMREQGRVFLNRLRERAIAAGVAEPDMRQRYGALAETLHELQGRVGLFLLARPDAGDGSERPDAFRDIERVVRGLHRPVLVVPGHFRAPRRFGVVLTRGQATRRAVERLADSALLYGLPCHLLISGDCDREAQRQLDWARSTLVDAGFEVAVEITPEGANDARAAIADGRSIDLLVLGAYAHSPLRSLLLGSRTNDLLRSTAVPVLLLR